MERASRVTVLVSLLLAGLAYAWLAGRVSPWLPWAAAAAFGATFGLARVSLPLGLAPALISTYLAPTLLMVAFGVEQYHQILVWLAALAGPVVAGSDWSRWHIPSPWKAPVALWALVIAVSWPVVAGREIDFSLTAAQTLDTPNGLLGGPPALTAAWVTSVALEQLVGLLWLDLLWARFGAERLRRAERVVFVPMLFSIAICSAVGIYQRYVDISWLNVGNWPSLGRAVGLMLDANSFGTAAAIWAPLVIGLAWRLGRPLWIGAVFAVLLGAGMWSSGSRTALLTGTAGLIGLGFALGRRVRAWQARLAPVALLVGGAALVLAVALGARTGDRANPLTRALETLPRMETGGLASFADDMWVRNGYGLAAVRAIQEHPWTGVGIGGFNQLATHYFYLSSGALIPPDNAQNWWRQQLAELGSIGVLPSLLFSVLVLLLVCRGSVSGEPGHTATLVRAVVVGIGLASLLGVATQHPALWMTFVTLVYWLGALVHAPPAIPRSARSQRALWIGGWIVAVAAMSGQAWTATHDLRVPTRAVRVGFPFAYGFSPPQPDPEFGELRWTRARAVAVLRAEHQYFELTMWTPHPDITSNPVRVKLWRGPVLVAEIQSRSAEPFSRILRVPDGGRFLMIETEVSRTFGEHQGLRVGGRWIRDVPPGTSPETVVD